MKWSIWVEPNQIFEEEYPNGWSHDDVFEAANARYAGKVTTVHPASSRGSEAGGTVRGGGSSGGGTGCAGFFWIAVGIIALTVFGGGEKSEEDLPEPTPAAPVRLQEAPKPVAPVARPTGLGAERDRTRGTNQSTNPLMRDFLSDLPDPTY